MDVTLDMVLLREGVSKVCNGIYVEGTRVGQVIGDADGRVKVPGELWEDGMVKALPGIERSAVRDAVGADSATECSVDVFHGIV